MIVICCCNALTTWPNVVLLIAQQSLATACTVLLYFTSTRSQTSRTVVCGKEAAHNVLIVGSFNDRARQGGNLRLHVAL